MTIVTQYGGKYKDFVRDGRPASVRFAASIKTMDMAGNILEESRKIRDVIRRMDNLHDYVLKTFPGGFSIIDIEKGSSHT